MYPPVSQSHVPQRRLNEVGTNAARLDKGRPHSKAVAHRCNCTENRRPAARWCAGQQPHGTFRLRDTQPHNERALGTQRCFAAHSGGMALPRTVGALPITTRLNRAAAVPKSATSPNVCTPVTPGCVAPSRVGSPQEESPPWGDSGLRLRPGRDTQQPCGCPAEPHPPKLGKMAHTCWLGQPAFWAFRKFFRLWAASLPSSRPPSFERTEEKQDRWAGEESGAHRHRHSL